MKLSGILLCVFTGVFLATAFWVYGDGVVSYHGLDPSPGPYRFKWAVPGLLTTMGMLALCVGVGPALVVERWEARLWAFATLTLAFVGIGLAVWILSADDLIGGGQQWAGISPLVQTLLLTLAGLLFFIRNGTGGETTSFAY